MPVRPHDALPSAPGARPRWRRRAGAATAVALLGGLAATPAGAGTWDYTCTSALTTTDEVNSVVGTAPATVPRGEAFVLSDVVLSGVTSIDLLLVELSFSLVPPDGAEPLDGLTRTWSGPGAEDPPGPYAPAGSDNASPPTSFAFRATGPVGSTIELWPGDVATTVADIGDPSATVDVDCARVGGAPLAVVEVVAASGVAGEGAVAGAGDAGGGGGTAGAATPVAADPALTG